ncbi:hypothetical protein AG0111_0g12346 [Alternaria gaisen]|uniref:Uncharacterized protein n=1 Tax=Alternaria gaisen TaxID=167740 RepID=A0ACB6F505_9PLEO|nr:hypothetical protein AG0111_0g12346 [Alternaria gaisen]
MDSVTLSPPAQTDCRQPPLSPMVETTTTTINEQGTRSSSLISPRISRVTTAFTPFRFMGFALLKYES